LRFLENRGADGGELKSDADIVQEAGGFLRVGSARGFSCDEIFEHPGGQPKWMFNVYFMSVGRTFADDIDGVVSFDLFFAETRDEVSGACWRA